MASTTRKGKLPLGRWPVRSLRLLVGIKANRPGGTQRCTGEAVKLYLNDNYLGSKEGRTKDGVATGKFSREQVRRAMLTALQKCALQRGSTGLSAATISAWRINP